MAIGRISYEDKKDYKIEGTDDNYRVTAKDMNEIKNVFNNSASTIELTEKKVDDAVSFIGTYKLENGLLYFKQADGTFGEGIELAGQTSVVIDEVVQENLTMSSTRDTAKDFETFVELKDSQGKKISVSVSPKNIFMKSGASEVSLEQIINGCEFDCGEDASSYFLGTFAEWVAYKNTLNLEVRKCETKSGENIKKG